jgi:uncharacterized repeat protein (TIGR04138 family)
MAHATNPRLTVLKTLALADGRYAPEAFIFVHDAFIFTTKLLRAGKMKPLDGAARERNNAQLSSAELLEGLRRLALERWGAMAKTVFKRWGVHGTEDFGAIVFCLVEKGGWSKRANESLDDFRDGFDFNTTFTES